MESKVILKALKTLCVVVFNYIKEALGEQLKEAFKLALEDFKETLWENIKHEATRAAKEALNYIETYYVNPDIQNRKEAIVRSVVEQIKLPVILKPFRKVISSMLIKKIDTMVSEIIHKTLNYIS